MHEPAVRSGIYRHFKGGEYEVIELARHSETEEAMVVYRPLYGERALWVRPLALFRDRKQIDGREQARFERIGDAPLPVRQAQAGVADFCREHQLAQSTPSRLLDLCSELGELAKVWLKSSAYGSLEAADPDPESWQAEFGDTLFALLCLANESGVSAETALEQTQERYRQRIERAGHPGSDAN